jgi:hypothetical protein
MSPLTKKGAEIMASMKKTYKSKDKAEQVFYASANKGTIKSVHKGGKKK